MDGAEFQPLAEIAVEQVHAELQGLTLTGQGPDHADYRLDVHFELPLDLRTRTVLSELLSHADLSISRRSAGGGPVRATLRARRDGAHRP
jgi:hypothetical protein